MPAAWVTSRAVAAGAYKTGDMSFKSDKTHRHLFWWMCGQLMQLAQMETSGSSDGGGGPLLSLPLPGEVSAMQPVHLKQWMASEAAVCKKEMEMAMQGSDGASLVAQYGGIFYTDLAELGEAPLHRDTGSLAMHGAAALLCSL